MVVFGKKNPVPSTPMDVTLRFVLYVAWLGKWFWNQTFYDDYIDLDVAEIVQLLKENEQEC